jgi:hypothetical protein
MCRKFSAVREHCPPEKLLAIRHSLFAVVSARQEPRPPNSFRPSPLVPRPVLSRWLRKQSPLKQANKKLRVLGCAFREKALTLNSQPATRNPSSSHPPRVGVQIRHHSLLAIHLTGTSLIYCCWRKRYLFWQNEQRGDGLWTSCGLWQWRST